MKLMMPLTFWRVFSEWKNFTNKCVILPRDHTFVLSCQWPSCLLSLTECLTLYVSVTWSLMIWQTVVCTRETPGNPVLGACLPWLGCQRFIRHHLWARVLAVQSDRNKCGRMKRYMTALWQKPDWLGPGLPLATTVALSAGEGHVLELLKS